MKKEPRFKVGDRVNCIRGEPKTGLIKGSTYTVRKFEEDLEFIGDTGIMHEDGVWIEGISRFGYDFAYGASRFKFVPTPPPPSVTDNIAKIRELANAPTHCHEQGD